MHVLSKLARITEGSGKVEKITLSSKQGELSVGLCWGAQATEHWQDFLDNQLCESPD
jgi:hypothetical protein